MNTDDCLSVCCFHIPNPFFFSQCEAILFMLEQLLNDKCSLVIDLGENYRNKKKKKNLISKSEIKISLF